MSPLRWDVLLVGFVLGLPVIALGLRGDLSPEEAMTRFLWCLAAGWAVVAVLRLAAAPAPAVERTAPAVEKKTTARQEERPSSEPSTG